MAIKSMPTFSLFMQCFFKIYMMIAIKHDFVIHLKHSQGPWKSNENLEACDENHV